MSFANKYVENQSFCDSFITDSVDESLKIVVTIPVYIEPNIIECLESLNSCNPIDGTVEVIIVINSSEKDSDEVRHFNVNTFNEIKNWISSIETTFIKYYVHLVENLPAKHAGVGLARKIAMDEALRRFNRINRPEGVITGYDADTLCRSNYFTSLETFFNDKSKRGASIYFEHPVYGTDYSNEVYESSAYYELYLRYYINALRYIGHPHAFHCIGSAYAVRAIDYSAQGGMNKRQAGEDFYFLQKIIAQGGFGDITDTVLSPSSRLSDRTPFGTGRSIALMCEQHEIDYNTYAFEAFLPLKTLFSKVDSYYKAQVNYEGLSSQLVNYLKSISFDEGVDEINRNCKSPVVFKDKFFKYMNIFKVLKYLNHASICLYPKESVRIGALKLLKRKNIEIDNSSVYSLLNILRDMDKQA